ncbi:PREDICTED: uncharacterized protein LOC109161886 isoform X2 [Ipomoea nil]|uniref:uncharacterized protein LOC109161886 isoform X2 n=1 Tax=Ipomoea nil TaxID=35883 RepID=UPI0009016F33|nr:PREDICTED: uncharacterized protein LOC109161886 isoform X2 [Ipomoea nil]
MGKGSRFLIGVALLCCWIVVANADYMLYKDRRQPVGRRIKDLMSRMTLKEKIGQMVQIERQVASAQVMKKYYLGSVLSSGGSVPKQNASAEAWVDMVNGFQKGSLSTRLGIPMIYGIDAVHGNNNAYNATIFPHNVGLGATRDPELVREIGAATALEVRATGIQYVFAPCIAVCRDPRWGRCYESYSEDPEIVRAMTEIIPGLQGEAPPNYPLSFPFVSGREKVAACAKHYVGDGGTLKGIDENNTLVDTHDLFSIHMAGYYNSIIRGVATVMASYSSLNGVRMHANRDMITGFLKKTLRFRGFVISDFKAIDNLTPTVHGNYTYSILTSINAGIDMNKFVPVSRIDDAVKRILRVKFVMGLFEDPLGDYSLVHHLGSRKHRKLARKAVRKSLVLLKNGANADEPVLPLQKKASRILVAGTHADNIGYQCGGWTIEWQGLSGNITIGRPVVIQPYLPQIDALVAAWLPGTEGQGVADVLFGDYGFSGKLPFTWFKTVDQLPMNVGDPHYDPLFPFGHGLITKPTK